MTEFLSKATMAADELLKDIITVNAAVNACEKSLKWSCASSLLTNAGCSQLQASEWSFNTVASSLFKSKQWRAALDLGDAIVTRGVLAFSFSNSWSSALAATESVNIDDIAWSAIVSACEKTVQWEVALTFLARMSQTRLQGSIVVCNAAISACGQQWRHAFRILTSSRAAQVQVDLISWNAVCSAAEKCSKWHKVFAFLSQLRPAALPGPDAFSYGAAFFAAAETAWAVALQLQGAMQMQDLQLDVIMQGSLLQALAHRSAKVEDSFDRLSALAISLCGMELWHLSRIAKGAALSGTLGRHQIYSHVADLAARAIEAGNPPPAEILHDISLALSLLQPWDPEIMKAVGRFREALVPLERSVQSTQVSFIGAASMAGQRNGEAKENQDTLYTSADGCVACVAVVDGHGRKGAVLSAAARDAIAVAMKELKSGSSEELAKVILRVDAELLIHQKAEPELSGATYFVKLHEFGVDAGTPLRRPHLKASLRPSENMALTSMSAQKRSSSCLGDLTIIVALPSGRTTEVSISQSSTVADLRATAVRALQLGSVRIISADGTVLDPTLPIDRTGLQSGDTVTAVALPPAKLAATYGAFAFWSSGTSTNLTAWGDRECGGSLRRVKNSLVDVQEVQSSSSAFAAILANGKVVAWGDVEGGGEMTQGVKRKLQNVRHLQSTHSAFAAILEDGSVVTWGDKRAGGNSSSVKKRLKKLGYPTLATEWAFAAIISDGSVVTWGDRRDGGNSSKVQRQLKDVRQIQSTEAAFCAIRNDGTVVAWGLADYGGDISKAQDRLKNVQNVQSTELAFAAILADGSVVAWGHREYGGDCTAVQDQLVRVKHIQGSAYAFAAILESGRVVTWGHPGYGGDSSSVKDLLSDVAHPVTHIQASEKAFAAIRTDGQVVAWGQAEYGGDASGAASLFPRNVQHIAASKGAFAGIRSDGKVVTWGGSAYGGDSRVQDRLRDVTQIKASDCGFTAIVPDAEPVTWGVTDGDGIFSDFDSQMGESEESGAVMQVDGIGQQKRRLSLVHLGDCGAVLGRMKAKNSGSNGSTWSTVRLTEDHRPGEDKEAARLLAAGARLQKMPVPAGQQLDPANMGPPRLWHRQRGQAPGLAMSRCLGDALGKACGLSPQASMLDMDLTEEDVVVVLGSDGIFDVLSDAEVLHCCRQFIESRAAAQAAEAVTLSARRQWQLRGPYIDDCTCVVLFL
eukprot:s565_g13.t1